MSEGKIAGLVLQLIFAILLIFSGIKMMITNRVRDESFSEYENLADCIRFFIHFN